MKTIIRGESTSPLHEKENTLEYKITLLPGDGIGPEVVGEATRVLEVIAKKYNHTDRKSVV